MLDASDEGELKGWGGGVLRARELDVLELCFEIEVSFQGRTGA